MGLNDLPSLDEPLSVMFFEPDIIKLVLRGDVDGEHVVRYIEMRERVAHLPYVLTLSDMRGFGRMLPSGKRNFAELRDPRPTALALLGGTLPARMSVNLVLGAARVLGRTKLVHRFFDDETEALAWLGEMREKFRPTGVEAGEVSVRRRGGG